mgnify:CR=1 FL=1|jgi:hypothetical protein
MKIHTSSTQAKMNIEDLELSFAQIRLIKRCLDKCSRLESVYQKDMDTYTYGSLKQASIKEQQDIDQLSDALSEVYLTSKLNAI